MKEKKEESQERLVCVSLHGDQCNKRNKKHSTQTYCGTFQACKRSPGCLSVSFKVLLSGHKVVVALASL